MPHLARMDEVSGTSYSSLLRALQSKQKSEPSQKKRKLAANGDTAGEVREQGSVTSAKKTEFSATDVTEPGIESGDDGTEELDHREQNGGDDDEDVTGNGDTLLHDPFEKHYSTASNLQSVDRGEVSNATDNSVHTVITDSVPIRKTWVSHRNDKCPPPVQKAQDLHLKQRLVQSAADLPSRLSGVERDIAGFVFNYCDVLAGCRTVDNAPILRDVLALHSLNHVLKTRDRVLKNNTKLSQSESPEALDIRDQGFTRPKVLVLLPTKQACVSFVESTVKLSEPEQQENKSRFLDTFSRIEENEWQEKAEDFRELFGGNHEEDFRLGLKFTRKTIKYFSGFYNSDIIVCSPLGLMRTVTTGGGGKEDTKVHDADFLSSIEITIMDHASALQVQNWQHVDYVLSQLNQLPKDAHGCDFSRVRNSYLDGHAKYLRQTIILSAYLTPEINSLVSSHLHNYAGRVKYVPSYKGAMLDVSNQMPMPVVQTFLRFQSLSALNDGDARFKHFTTTVLPQLLRDRNNQSGVLLFIPSYADFTQVRNHLSNSREGTTISFGGISEYTPVKDVSRARSHFMNGRHSVLLYSERAHHYFRYRIRGVRKVVFYGVPENPVFWTEVIGLLGLEVGNSESGDTIGKGAVRALFSKWDVLKLERVVGTERVGRLMSERIGDTFDFV